MSKILFSAFLLLSASESFAAAPRIDFTGPGGIQGNCNAFRILGLEEGKIASQIGTHGMFNVKFINWTPEIATFLKTMADQCADAQLDAKTQEFQNLAKRSPGMNLNPPPIVIENIIHFRDKAKQAIDEVMAEADRERAKYVKQQQAAQCASTNEALLFRSQELVISDEENLAGARKMLDHEHRVAETSGVRNLSNERQLGETIVNFADRIKPDFGEYKRLGGKAATPSAVGHDVKNLCE